MSYIIIFETFVLKRLPKNAVVGRHIFRIIQHIRRVIFPVTQTVFLQR